MGAERNRLLLPILACLILISPLGEGGATPLALLITQTLGAAGAMALLVDSRRRLSWDGESKKVALAAAGFLVLACVASIGSPYLYASFLRCLDYALLLGVFTLAGSAGWSAAEKILLVDCVLAAASLQAVGVLLATARGTLASFVARFGLLNTNHEAAFLLVAVFVAAPGIVTARRMGARVTRILAISTCLLAFVLLMSRGALLGLAAGLGVLLALRWRGLTGKGRLLAAIGACLFLALSAAALRSRFQPAEDPYRFERLRIWGADLQCFLGHPFLGVGPGIFRHVAPQYNFPLQGVVRFGRHFETPHGDYLGFLVEMGLPGLAMGLLLFFLAFRAALRRRAGGEVLAEGVLCAVAALSAHALVEDLSTRPALTVTMAALVGSCLSAERGRITPHPRRRLTAAIAGILLILLWWVAVLNPYLAFARDQAMRNSTTYPQMDGNFRQAIRLNPYQAPTYRYPISVFLSSRPPVPLSVDLYARFRRDVDAGIQADGVSADLRLAKGRAEIRAFSDLFHDAATRDRALAEYQAAIALAPHDPRIRLELAAFLREVGLRDQAAEQLGSALEEEPNYLGARLLLTRVLLDRGDRVAALRSWGEAEKVRTAMANYRPDSGYAADIVRDSKPLRQVLEGELGPP